LLPGADRDLVRVLEKRLTGLFDSIMLETKVVEMKEQKNGIKATFDSKSKDVKKSGIFDKVLIAVGRQPNSNDIGLENTKVELAKPTFVKVDLQRKTSDDAIYAIGDVAGEPMLAHKATAEGRAAVEAIAGRKVAFEPQAIPAVVFTDPEVAWCGLTEAEARDQKREVEISKFPWGASGRARTLGITNGVTKLIVEPKSKRLLGMGIAGPGAGEMIAEGVLAIEMGANAADIGLTIHQHPTLSETIMEAADLIYGNATDFYRPKRK
jgi:dihydrolipoamide dehydrogenase